MIDTSVMIEHLRTGKGVLANLVKSKAEIQVLLIPAAVIYEVWSGKSMNKTSEVKKVNRLLQDFELVELTFPIAQKAGELRRNGYCDGIDALVAATALEYKAFLATLNHKHFVKIPGLELWGD